MSTKIDIEIVGHRVLLKPHFDEDVVKEGALEGFVMDVGETFKREKAATIVGEVVGIGSMAWKAFDGDHPDWEPWAKLGDIVYFAKYAGKFITSVSGEEYIIVNDADIQAIYQHAEDIKDE